MNERKLIEVLLAINELSNDPKLKFHEKLNKIIVEITNILGASSGSIMLLKNKKMEVIASTKDCIIGFKQDINEDTPSSYVVKTGKILYINNLLKDHRFHKKYNHYNKNAFIIVPIISKEKVIGVISLTDKIGVDQFTQDEQEILMKIAGHVISKIENQRLTDDLRKKKNTLQKRNQQLRQLERLKTDLFRMLIHDLKGPISEVIANLDILSYTAKEENRVYVEHAKTGCDTLYSMTCNLLDIARLEEGKLELLYEKIEPEDLIREAKARVYWAMEQKSLRFKETIPPPAGVGGEFWGDRGILLRILQNLLANAVHYSPRGKSVGFGYDYPKGEEIRFYVEDKGPGVPPEHQAVIFDKFAQLDKKGDGRIYTTGLGLTFCKMAVEAHEGTISIESDGQLGSRFAFSLPLGKS